MRLDKTILFLSLAAVTMTVYARRGEFLNSTGKDGAFHLDKKMYLCLNFGFDPGPDPRNSANLKGELLFDGIDGHDGLAKADACIPVTQKMIDRQNKVLDAVSGHGGMKEGESVTLPTKK